MGRKDREKSQAKPKRAARQQPTGPDGRRATAEGGGLRYGGGVIGKRFFRIRVRHVADHLAPLISRRALGAAKLALVLRGVGLYPQHTGGRAEPGIVISRYSWEQLHDLARTAGLGTADSDFDPPPAVIKLKRDWVRDQLVVLEEMGLVRRELRPGGRSRLIMLRDDGSGEPQDDPVGTGGEVYITIRGDVIASGALARWGAPELCAYLAATYAERYDRVTLNAESTAPGEGEWFRPLAWFADSERRFGADARIRIPFSVPTLERGLGRLREEGLVTWHRITRNPKTRTRLRGPRNYYFNHFGLLGAKEEAIDADAYVAEVADDDDVDGAE